MQYFEEPKEPEDDDRYQFTIPLSWLDGESIQSVIWEVDPLSGLTISNQAITDNKVSALFSGGNVGRWCVSARVYTATRDKEACGLMTVEECC